MNNATSAFTAAPMPSAWGAQGVKLPRVSERIIEMTWRCSSCAHRNLGRHKICVQCGSPKDGSEAFEMPDDPSKAASVTQADLLRMALDGPDWRCAYCGSDQRRADRACARCGAAALEGAEVTEPAPRDTFAGAPYDWQPVEPGPRWYARREVRVAALAVLAVFVLGIGARAWARRPRDLDGRVSARTWRQSVRVERWAIRTREGFRESQVGEVFDVSSLGPRVHHHEQVLDHYDTESYTVRVQDGYDTESYTAQVACGRDCTSTPQSCSERCTSNRNGFASCRTVCSGGGQSCTTRYCSESRTRQVPRYRDDPRTRQVPRYRSEARYAEAFRWRVWDWAPQRVLVREGTSEPTRWPTEDELALDRGLSPGERERASREGMYRVTLRDDDERLWRIHPAREEDFARFAQGSVHRVHREAGRVTVDGRSWPGLP